jgi:alkylation response protein AidB-like acyl-CoA dehydrogenase
MIGPGDAGDERDQLTSLLDSSAGETPHLRLTQLVAAGFVMPLPMGGRAATRFALLRCLGRHDLSLARLAEGHADALAILAEAGYSVQHETWLSGVWAAGPVETLTATRTADGWQLDGIRRWCSGAPVLDVALVRASAEDGERLFLVPLDVPGIQPIADSWPAIGMAESLTLDVSFDKVELPAAAAVGSPNFYLSRRGFWIGGAGVAAVWLGGAEGVASILRHRVQTSPHALAHLGSVTARLTALDALLATVVQAIEHPDSQTRDLERFARIFRAEVERAVTDVLEWTGRATGADPLCHDREHAQRVADLTVYVRQSHAESDLEAIGRLEQTLLRGAAQADLG